MKKLLKTVIGASIFTVVMSACSNTNTNKCVPQEILIPDINATTESIVETEDECKELMSIAPLRLYSFDELRYKSNVVFSSESIRNDYNLANLKTFYAPTFMENFAVLSHIEINSNGSHSTFYNLENSESSEFGFFDFTFVLDKVFSGREARILMENTITEWELNPWGYTEGVYYKDFDNNDSTLTNGRQFFWLQDGYFAFMQLTTDMVEYMESVAPEVFHGELFELEQIDLSFH
ncbi:MAG: hypothetical protein FWF76_00300 [Oscillospiraceae bacterium]|nr:hypothetical protein [Oscillospiraceae bacterium]